MNESQSLVSTQANEEEQFVDRMSQVLDAGAVSVMLSIGHRLGLFDTLAKLPPSTSQQIADAATLAERYVREWLAVMVVAGIIRYEPLGKTYQLPSEHAACLTRGAPLGNLAVYAQFVGMAGAVQDRILECFQSGDGLSYSEYPCFHQIMAEDSGQTVDANIDDLLVDLVPDLVTRLEQGIDIVDAGCGAGRVLVSLARRFPKSQFTGYDLCPEAIQMAERNVSKQGLSNVTFKVLDLAGWDEAETFDVATSFDSIHDTRHPEQLIKTIHRALKPGGVHLMQDIGGSAYLENNIDFPFAAFLYAMSTVHCTPVSLAQGGDALGTMWGWETADRMIRNAGFESAERHVLPHDAMNVWFVNRKAS